MIADLLAAGIPVMAHCGLRPQGVHQLGGYRVQRDEEQLLPTPQAAREGRRIRDRAGVHSRRVRREDHRGTWDSHDRHRRGRGCDGQVLVLHDLLGLTSGYVPKFVKPYADLRDRDEKGGRPFPRRRAGRKISWSRAAIQIGLRLEATGLRYEERRILPSRVLKPQTSEPASLKPSSPMPNRLADETSPYLLPHRDNPVDWHPWGAEALHGPGARRSRSSCRLGIRLVIGAM